MLGMLHFWHYEYLGLEFMAYLGWQAYLAMQSWTLPEDDPPDGGVPSDQRTPALVGF